MHILLRSIFVYALMPTFRPYYEHLFFFSFWKHRAKALKKNYKEHVKVLLSALNRSKTKRRFHIHVFKKFQNKLSKVKGNEQGVEMEYLHSTKKKWSSCNICNWFLFYFDVIFLNLLHGNANLILYIIQLVASTLIVWMRYDDKY